MRGRKVCGPGDDYRKRFEILSRDSRRSLLCYSAPADFNLSVLQAARLALSPVLFFPSLRFSATKEFVDLDIKV